MMYQHVTDTRPDQEPLRIDVEQLMNALRRIIGMTGTCKKSWNISIMQLFFHILRIKVREYDSMEFSKYKDNLKRQLTCVQ